MRQILQELGAGKTIIADVPPPNVPERGLLIASRRSLISAGTERMLVEFSRAGWIDKARQQPEKVRQVLDKVRTDGPIATLDAVRSQLDRDLPLGYCNVGVVMDTGQSVSGFSTGDRVASNGPHSEVVAVPVNLCARIPDDVSDDAAAFTVLAAIGLQGVRLTEPTIGESFVVIGLGLVGLLTVQILRANGCRVLGVDPDPTRTALAREFGATVVNQVDGEDVLDAADRFSRGHGVDGVLITAATKSDEPVSQAARMCRKRGRIVLVGVTGLHLNRSDFYEKELTFQVSCSYGPGRYDPRYEVDGIDYPLASTRWTVQRNFEAVLDLMASGTLQVDALISHRVALADAGRAYDMLAAGDKPYLGILLEYEEQVDAGADATTVKLADASTEIAKAGADPVVSVIGSGNYASRILLPALAEGGASFLKIASSGGQTAASVGRKHGFAEVTSDVQTVFDDPRANTVVVATRHDSHAQYVCDALAAGKNVFVEKPLALSHAEIDSVVAVRQSAPDAEQPLVMVGFNRRFSPFTQKMKTLLDKANSPKTFIVTVNAGELPAEHWTQDATVGGGRIVGEACHFIDLLRFLVGAPVVSWQVTTIGGDNGTTDDKASISLNFADGSMATVHYFANGHSTFPKERIEAFCAGSMLQLDNFRRLRGFGWNGFRSMGGWRQDKGQQACAAEFLAAVRGGKRAPIAFDEIVEVSRICVDIAAAARNGGGHGQVSH